MMQSSNNNSSDPQLVDEERGESNERISGNSDAIRISGFHNFGFGGRPVVRTI